MKKLSKEQQWQIEGLLALGHRLERQIRDIVDALVETIGGGEDVENVCWDAMFDEGWDAKELLTRCKKEGR